MLGLLYKIINRYNIILYILKRIFKLLRLKSSLSELGFVVARAVPSFVVDFGRPCAKKKKKKKKKRKKGGARGVMVIVVGNGHDDTDCIFT